MNLELIILSELDLAHPRSLKRGVLLGDVRMASEADVTEDGLGRALRGLEKKGQVRIDAGEDVTRIGITPSGRTRVAEANA